MKDKLQFKFKIQLQGQQQLQPQQQMSQQLNFEEKKLIQQKLKRNLEQTLKASFVLAMSSTASLPLLKLFILGFAVLHYNVCPFKSACPPLDTELDSRVFCQMMR